jgi:hypothetical protein
LEDKLEEITFREPAKLKEQPYYGGGDDDTEMITMPREVFDQISKLTETVFSQQKTIEILAETNKKMVAHTDTVICAAASGLEIKK